MYRVKKRAIGALISSRGGKLSPHDQQVKGAEDFDFKPIVLKGSLASDNVEHIRFVEEISEKISIGALKTLL